MTAEQAAKLATQLNAGAEFAALQAKLAEYGLKIVIVPDSGPGEER